MNNRVTHWAVEGFFILCLCAFFSAEAKEPDPNRDSVDAKPSLEIDVPSTASTPFDVSLAAAVKNYLEYDFRQNRITGTNIQMVGSIPEATANHFSQADSLSNILFVSVSGYLSDDPLLLPNSKRGYSFKRVKEQLHISIKAELLKYDPPTNRFTTAQKTNVTETSRPRWIHPRTPNQTRSVDSLISSTAEPLEFVLARTVEKLVDNLDLGNSLPLEIIGSRNLFARILVDSNFVNEHASNWTERAAWIVITASSTLAQAFNCSLEIIGVDISKVQDTLIAHSSLSLQFHHFCENYLVQGDTLIIGLTGGHGVDFFTGRDSDQIGLSEIGGTRILLKAFPVVNHDLRNWQGMFSGRSLAHEIGHLMGAIHVSDMNSIMSPMLSWTGTENFDSFNREIIRHTLADSLDPSDPVEYAATVGDMLSRGNHRLVDFPPIAYRGLVAARSKNQEKQLKTSVQSPVYLLAGEAFGHYANGNVNVAASLFREAISKEPRYAALHYYYALCTQGQISLDAMTRAAELGHWQAQVLLQGRREWLSTGND